MPTLRCRLCGKEFYGKPCHIRMGYCKYCSRSCKAKAQKTGKILKCDICQKDVWKTPKAIKSSKSGRFFCSKRCQTLWRNKYYSGTRHPNWLGGEFQDYRRFLIDSGRKEKCVKCGVEDLRILVAHHLDRNRRNNNVINLVYLCMNCHFLIHRHNEKIK